MLIEAAAIAILVMVGGCGRRHFFVENSPGSGLVAPCGSELKPPRQLAMFAGHTARSVSWDDVRDAMQWADVILVGEQHNDAVAHRVEQALVADAVAMGQPTGVSMEMLERDEQPIVDAYLAGEISQEQFVTRTGSANWGAKGKWGDWYQPMVDAARDAGRPVIAANAPRRYVKEARVEGYGALWARPPVERKHFFIPRRILTGSYADRFMGVMTRHAAPTKPRKKATPTTCPAAKKPTTCPAAKTPTTCPVAKKPTTRPAKRRMPHRRIDPKTFYRAQLVWDATMAGSIAEGLDNGLARVIHVVGQFHTDFDGGTVQYLLDRKPDLKILTVSLQNAYSRVLRDDDRNRADVVIYTLAAPKEDNKSAD